MLEVLGPLCKQAKSILQDYNNKPTNQTRVVLKQDLPL
jgi:hypothetical protein